MPEQNAILRRGCSGHLRPRWNGSTCDQASICWMRKLRLKKPKQDLAAQTRSFGEVWQTGL